MSDTVNHPSHYGQVPGVECIDVVEHFPFNRGNAIKYLWRAGAKGDVLEDLKKAAWYVQREIDSLTSAPVEDGVDLSSPMAIRKALVNLKRDLGHDLGLS